MTKKELVSVAFVGLVAAAGLVWWLSGQEEALPSVAEVPDGEEVGHSQVASEQRSTAQVGGSDGLVDDVSRSELAESSAAPPSDQALHHIDQILRHLGKPETKASYYKPFDLEAALQEDRYNPGGRALSSAEMEELQGIVDAIQSEAAEVSHMMDVEVNLRYEKAIESGQFLTVASDEFDSSALRREHPGAILGMLPGAVDGEVRVVVLRLRDEPLLQELHGKAMSVPVRRRAAIRRFVMN